MGPTCIICHMEIVDGLDEKEECPNGHPAHMECLREWLVHSPDCPLCSTRLPPDILQKHKGFLEDKKKQEKDELKAKIHQESLQKIEQIAEKMVFLKFIEGIEPLVEKKEYELALDRLDAFDDSHQLVDFKGQDLMFLRGKINYLKGRYDLAINFLFKLVKEKFDYPDGFLFLGKAYEELGLPDKAKWAYDRIQK